jgi:CRISPR/Cas system-associated exonuclease Cas4 (RecB family)
VGTDFKNEFSWSNSRDRLFQRCKRAYFWRYYAHWGGWDRRAPEQARVAYRLGKQDSFATWAGTIVHDTIEEAIKALRDRRQPIELDALKSRARAMLRRGWVQSRDGHWVSSPKRAVCLWEHYYGDDEDRRPERTKYVSDVVYGGLQGFVDGPWPELLARVPVAGFRNIEVLDTIPVNGRKVYVKPDLAFEHPDDGLIWLVDWKTGVPKEADQFQVASYALFAREKWGVRAEQTRTVLAYVSRGEQQDFSPTDADLDAARDRIAASMEAMASLLQGGDQDANEAAIEDFPMTEDEGTCRSCNFRQLCFGIEGVPGATQAGDSRQLSLAE